MCFDLHAVVGAARFKSTPVGCRVGNAVATKLSDLRSGQSDHRGSLGFQWLARRGKIFLFGVGTGNDGELTSRKSPT